MHERGVCGCPVVFPDLIRPRVMGRSPFETADQRSSVAKGKGYRGKSRNKRSGKIQIAQYLVSAYTHSRAHTPAPTATHSPVPPPTSHPKKATANNASRLKKSQTPSQEESRSNNLKEAKPAAEISVQVPSFYGAEWVDEHRQLHNAGSCKCEGDFSFYKSPEVYGTPSPSLNNGHAQLVHTRASHPAPGRTFESTTASVYMYGQTSSHTPQAFPSSSYTSLDNAVPGSQRPFRPDSSFEGLQGLHKQFQPRTQAGSQQVSLYPPRPILACYADCTYQLHS